MNIRTKGPPRINVAMEGEVVESDSLPSCLDVALHVVVVLLFVAWYFLR